MCHVHTLCHTKIVQKERAGATEPNDFPNTGCSKMHRCHCTIKVLFFWMHIIQQTHDHIWSNASPHRRAYRSLEVLFAHWSCLGHTLFKPPRNLGWGTNCSEERVRLRFANTGSHLLIKKGAVLEHSHPFEVALNQTLKHKVPQDKPGKHSDAGNTAQYKTTRDHSTSI